MRLEKVTEELGTADENPGTGGGQSNSIWNVFQGGSTGVVDFGDRDVGDDPRHGTGPGKFSTQGRAADHGEIAEEAGGGGLGIYTAGGRNGGGGLQGYWGLYTKVEEHGCAIYCDATDSVPLQEVGAEAGSLGLLGVTGTGGDRPSGYERECGGGGRGGGEGTRRGGAGGDNGKELKAGDIMWCI